MSKRVGLISCSKTKRETGTVAGELYTSPLFRAAQAYVRNSCDRYFILSAKHGLVAPYWHLEPYDLALADLNFTEKIEWAKRVGARLKTLVPEYSWIELHAGRAYTDPLWTSGVLDDYMVQEPCRGMKLGERLHFYKEAAVG